MADRAQLERELAAARELLAKLTTCEKIYNRINAATEIENILDVITTAAKGTPRKLIALHLIITPEYVRYIHTHYPQLVIYGLRLDRGLSDADVLATVPGTYHERERGLNEKDYIVPGAGGLGEVINNSYV